MEITSKGTGPSEFATPLITHGLNPRGAVHWNLGWEALHGLAVERGEACLTAHGVLLATTGERTGR
ncbi:MAG: phosphoenolpyruvate carboxykinase (ATP), partial [Candidatus Poseidoniia archaeon]